jgi:ABC-2 type transport system ATP-binding protein
VLVSSHLMGELQDSASHLVAVGRGRVLADTSVAELIAAASAGRVTLRTTAPAEAAAALTQAGAEVAAADSGVLQIKGISSERTVALLTQHAIAFSEVSSHRATLEDAYLELSREAVEFSAAEAQAASW